MDFDEDRKKASYKFIKTLDICIFMRYNEH